jgi:hypothetical protein
VDDTEKAASDSAALSPTPSKEALGPPPEGARRADAVNPWWQRGFSILGIVVWLAAMFTLLWWPQVNQSIVISLSLGTIALVTFAGFYSATGPEGMRTAIAATLVVFYLVLITHLIAAPGLRNALDTPAPAAVAGLSAAPIGSAGAPQSPVASPIPSQTAAANVAFGRDIFNGLTDFVKIVLLFYFTAVTAEKAVTTLAGAAQSRSKIQAAATTHAADRQAETAKHQLAAANVELETAKVASTSGARAREPGDMPG